MSPSKTVGIIANPASGKDIRRLTAHGSVFDNYEKVNIVRRLLLGLEAVGVTEVLYMPDYFNIVPKAMGGIKINFIPQPVEMQLSGTQEDSTVAAHLMEAAGVASLVTLGGDGTNRAVAKGSMKIPIMPISTGTNNVFPVMVEGTLAGLAAGVLASGRFPVEVLTRPSNRLDILIDNQPQDLALVDIAIYDDIFIGARAVLDMSKVREVFLSQVTPATVGLSAIGGFLAHEDWDPHQGMHIQLGKSNQSQTQEILAPIAPGLIKHVWVSNYSPLKDEQAVPINAASFVLALDGEREIVLRSNAQVMIRFSQQGPRVLDVSRTLQIASQHSFFQPIPTD